MDIYDNGSHGRVFKQHCARINKYGWNLSRTTDASDWKLSDEAQKKEANRLSKASYNILVYKEPIGTQFIVRVSKGNELTFYNHIKYVCKLECKMFKSNDAIFDKLPNCRNKIRGKRLTNKDNEFAKYMI
jgi:hypothetical protein